MRAVAVYFEESILFSFIADNEQYYYDAEIILSYEHFATFVQTL